MNECAESNETLCGAGTCRNLLGGYLCTCPAGYLVGANNRSCHGAPAPLVAHLSLSVA